MFFENLSSFKIVLNFRKAYIFKSFLKVYYRSVFDESSKAFTFKSVLEVYTLSKILLWIKPSYFSLENACYSWCMHQTRLFNSASVQCHKVNLPASCEAQRLLCHKLKLSCVARRP